MKSKICKLCGKEFIPTKNAQRICSDTHYRSCEVCGKKFVITMPSNSQRCCSKACTEKKRVATMQKRYGVSYTLQNPEAVRKAEQTCLSKFGVKRAAQSENIKQKMRDTCQKRYGVNTPFQMPDFWDKFRKTSLERYGVEYPMQTDWFKQKMQKTCQSRYGAPYTFQSKIVQERSKQTCEEKYGVPYPCMSTSCREASHNVISQINKNISDLLKSESGLDCELDKIHIQRFSYDIHILNTNILLEIDPTYTHNALGNHWGPSAISETYHLEKTKLAEANGYRCIHIFDWDDTAQIARLLKPKEIIYARKCDIRVVSSDIVNNFESYNHLQGSCRGQRVCYGLYYEDKLVQLMTFGKPRYNKNYQWELLRLCSDFRYRVVGGAEKLFRHFVREYNPSSIISYCDLAKFKGVIYPKLGFTLYQTTPPNKIWSYKDKKITNNLLMARGYDQLFKTSYGKGTSNEELMIQSGWLPVYDCGQAVYIWKH